MGTRVVYRVIDESDRLLATLFSNSSHLTQFAEDEFRRGVAAAAGPSELLGSLLAAKYETGEGNHRAGDRLFFLVPPEEAIEGDREKVISARYAVDVVGIGKLEPKWNVTTERGLPRRASPAEVLPTAVEALNKAAYALRYYERGSNDAPANDAEEKVAREQALSLHRRVTALLAGAGLQSKSPSADIEFTRHDCAIALTIEQWDALHRLDYLREVAPALEAAGALQCSVEYNGHLGRNLYFKIDAETNPGRVKAAMETLLATPSIAATRRPAVDDGGEPEEITFTESQRSALATLFLQKLQAAVGPEKYAQIVALNQNRSDPHVCHSHDFIDANMVMGEAFEEVMGFETDLRSSTQANLWSLAWADAVHTMCGEFAPNDPRIESIVRTAHELTVQLDKVYEAIDKQVDPLARAAMKWGDQDLDQLIARLPRGFHRSELQTALNGRTVAGPPATQQGVNDTPAP